MKRIKVADLGRENYFADVYDVNIQKTQNGRVSKIHYFAVCYGLSIGIIAGMYAGIFWFSSYLISEGFLEASKFADIFRVLLAIMMAAMTSGQTAALAPDFGAALISAGKIVKLLEKKVECLAQIFQVFCLKIRTITHFRKIENPSPYETIFL